MPCLLVLLIAGGRKISWAQKGCVLAAAVAGFALASAPQAAINQALYGKTTFLLASEDGSGLFLNQLYDGIYQMKYETVTDPDREDDCALCYVDPVGQAIMDEECYPTDFVFGNGTFYMENMDRYVELVQAYPLDFVGIYARHLFNLVDIRHPEVYITSLKSTSKVWPMLNFTVLYLALASLWMQFRNEGWKRRARLWYLFLALLPTLAIIPGAIETRFSVGLMLLLWGAWMGCANKTNLSKLAWRGWLGLAAGWAAFLCFALALGGIVGASNTLYMLF